MDVKKLIEEVLMDLGNNKTLADVSTKIQIIVRLLGDDKLKKWYECEFITGYKGKDFPEYRISKAADIKASYIRPQGFGAWKVSGQSVPVVNLGAEKYKEIMTVRCGDTISAIIEYSKHPSDIAMSLSPYELILVQRVLGEAQIQSVHKELSPSTFKSIIDNVQGKIIDMFMDLDEKIFNGELDFRSGDAKKEIKHVVNNYITAGIVQTGDGRIDASNSNIGANIGVSEDTKEQLKTILDEIERLSKATDDEFNDVAQEISDIRSELASKISRSAILKKSFKALSWGVSVSCKAAIEELVGKALDLL